MKNLRWSKNLREKIRKIRKWRRIEIEQSTQTPLLICYGSLSVSKADEHFGRVGFENGKKQKKERGDKGESRPGRTLLGS